MKTFGYYVKIRLNQQILEIILEQRMKHLEKLSKTCLSLLKI